MLVLSTMQMKFLKKTMMVKQAVSNSFVCLELGVLPVEYEIHKRQLSFLHHIIHLEDDDPVKRMWKNQKQLPEHNNWWNGVEKLMVKYSIQLSEEDIKKMSKEVMNIDLIVVDGKLKIGGFDLAKEFFRV